MRRRGSRPWSGCTRRWLCGPARSSGRSSSTQRHGTQCLIANFEVATGQVLAPTVGPTRTEEDFAAHIAQTIATDAEAPWIFVVDQLNTHQSEALVRLVAAADGIRADLGVKGKAGFSPRWPRARPFSKIPAIGSGSCTRPNTAPG